MMSTHYDTTEYLFASTRIRALENKIIGKDKIQRLADAQSNDDIKALLIEAGLGNQSDEQETDIKSSGLSGSATSNTDISSMLDASLDAAFAEVSDSCDKFDPTAFLRFQYDCCNIKLAIKCLKRSIDFENMLFKIGTVPPSHFKDIFINKRYDEFPKNMASAIDVAETEFAKSKNPQMIDIVLDKACFADMLDFADKTNIDYAKKLVRLKIDITNVMMCDRVIRMNRKATGLLLLKESLIDGGTIDKSDILNAFDGGEEQLFSLIEFSHIAGFFKLISDSDKSLSAIERCADDFFMQNVKDAKFIPYGAEVLIGFLIAHEYEVKNIRIILAGKAAGLNSEIIRERIRDSYV